MSEEDFSFKFHLLKRDIESLFENIEKFASDLSEEEVKELSKILMEKISDLV